MRYYKPKFCWILVSFWILFCLGCSSSLQQIYEGSPLPTDEIARVSCSNYISEIINIDGKNMTELKFSFITGGSKIALLPGTHELTVVFKTREESTIKFTVKAGKRYELTRWGNNAVLTLFIDPFNTMFVAPVPGTNDVIVRSPRVGLDGVNLLSVDGDSRYSPVYGFAIRLAPGPHTFTLSFRDIGGFFQSTQYSKESMRISGNLEAGHIYVVDPRIERDVRRWSPILVKHTLRSAT